MGKFHRAPVTCVPNMTLNSKDWRFWGLEIEIASLLWYALIFRGCTVLASDGVGSVWLLLFELCRNDLFQHRVPLRKVIPEKTVKGCEAGPGLIWNRYPRRRTAF
jgi:hypothetical protein